MATDKKQLTFIAAPSASWLWCFEGQDVNHNVLQVENKNIVCSIDALFRNEITILRALYVI